MLIAVALSTIVLISPGPKSPLHFAKNLDDYEDDLPTNGNEVTADDASDVNSTYIHPELSKFEFIHGQLKDLTICLALFNITERNGACLVHQPKSFYAASEMCISHNMTLLDVDSDHDKQRIFEETEKIFGSGGGTRIWMNGKYSVAEKVFLSAPKDQKMFITNDQIEGGRFSDGECLAVESWRRGKYQISSVPCRAESYFYCEF